MKVLVFVLASIIIGMIPQLVVAQIVDFNINTQVVDLRSTGSSGDGALNPGFNPCVNGTRSEAGVCEGGNGLLNPTNLEVLFPSLGTGSVTDNMFGMITFTGPNCTAFDPNASGFQAGLNCGDLRSNPDSQGQSIPVTLDTANNAINTLTDTFSTDNAFTSDFCNGTSSDCGTSGAAHAGFDITNAFTWDPTSPTSADVTVNQVIRQVTALNPNDTIGTIDTPGSGDQLFEVATSWTNISGADGVTQTDPEITWRQIIQDPNQSGLGSAFSINVGGVFTANETLAPPTATYPSGSTQTQRSQGQEPDALETLP